MWPSVRRLDSTAIENELAVAWVYTKTVASSLEPINNHSDCIAIIIPIDIRSDWIFIICVIH